MTLKDIAKECNVSIMTVSNVIRGNHNKVSQSTINRVNEVIKKYDYVPNLNARSLSSNSSHLILLCIPYIKNSDMDTIYDSYLIELLGAIERELMINGYFAMIRSIYDTKDIEAMYKIWNIDGTIFLFPFSEKSLLKINNYDEKNFVVIDGYYENKKITTVKCNDEDGCYKSTKYLIDKGHKNILFAGEHKGNKLLTARYRGYSRALKEAGISHEHNANIIVNRESGYNFGKHFREEYPDCTAIVTTSDMCALGIIDGATEAGLSVPDDFSIIGFDDIMICNLTKPTLTSINQNTAEKGRLAVRALIRKIAENTEVESPMTDTKLVIRNSVKELK